LIALRRFNIDVPVSS